MWLPDDETRWTARFKWLEIGWYNPRTNKISRKQVWRNNIGEALLIQVHEIDTYRRQHQNTGLYTSVFNYDTTDLEHAARLGNLYFDLDNLDPELVHREARTLVEYLDQYVPEEALRIYFTGMKGFHIEAECIAMGIGPASDLAGSFRFIASTLKDELGISSFDFSVYDWRRMWRLPNSRHQKTGLYKVELPREVFFSSFDSITNYAVEPRWDAVPPQTFNAKANEWYREWTYKKETKTYTTQDLIDRFAKYGTGTVRKMEGERQFDPKTLFDNCHAILDLWKQAEQTRNLPHEARLFLCSILSYSEEAQFYLHEILKNCDDYNPEKSQAHIDDWIRRRELGIGGRPYSCARANAAGVGCGDCHLEPKKKWLSVGDKMVETTEDAEPSPIRFAYVRKK